MKITRAVVPSLFTVLNMFCGFMSIIHASRGEYVNASWFIVLAAGFDSLDGVMARITKSSSEFGVEIDSLSDAISFGAAPAFLVYRMSLYQLEAMGIIVSSLLMIFGALRLARFNVQLVGFDKDYFSGLPIPASALTVASFTLNYYSETTGLDPRAEVFLPWLSVLLGLLMVSKVKYDTLPKVSRRALKKEPWKFVFASSGDYCRVCHRRQRNFPAASVVHCLGAGTVCHHHGRRKMTRPHAKFEDDEAVEPTQVEP